ncbi:hypothetical protein KCU73_g5949, partial [Aureobasidium melanogenum]
NNNNNNVEDAWDAYWGHIIRQNSQLADHLQSDSGAHEAVTMTDNNKVDTAHTSRSKAKQVKVHATCESCRKLKIKCFPTRDGSSCENAISRPQPQQSTTTYTATLKMSHTQRTDERASGSAPDGKTPLFFGEHENEKDMWVDHLRPAGTAPTVLRGGQMSAETAAFVEANHILISDPAWVSGLLEAPVMGSLHLLSQPVTYLPGYDTQAGYYPASTQAAQYWDGMQGGTGYNSYAHYPRADQSAYGHHPDASQAGYAYGDSAVAYPMTNSMINHAFQGAGNNLWNNSLAPGAPAMPFAGPAATAPVPRRSRSPIKHQTLPYRRRSPPELNPVAPSFAPSFAPPFASSSSSHQPFLPGYPTAPGHTSYPTVQGRNLATYGSVVGRRGAWNFSGGVHAGTPYQTRLQEARVLAGSQRRFSPGSDDVRKPLPSGSSAASNEGHNDDDEQESDEVEGAEEEEDDAEREEDANQEEEEEEEENANKTPIPRKRQGKFHADNARISCDECRRKHIKCVRPNPNRSCIGCLRAHRGPKVCKITKSSGN